ncbi:hypothetical protein LshimejAT787_2400630 [Lyophyllum shimeji]|uniref:Uncharacterized protein n=1 Tax=Lyophyllum shimeji TaxID=47721 RepID=A0A9P3Q0X1_LYOSH|nr:hypothetical protein LshimejAT787_2400630 [Lyophyllum shimeji]
MYDFVKAMSSDASRRTPLPIPCRYAIWVPGFGLWTSPIVPAIPVQFCTKQHTDPLEDYTAVHDLPDEHIWLAFYPRVPVFSGPLLSPLRVPHDRLVRSIHAVVVHGVGFKYFLDLSIRRKWELLETQLLGVAFNLLDHHRQHSRLPPVSWPIAPRAFGYLDGHSSGEDALRAAKRARRAFINVIAFASFAFSLWLTEHEEDCHEKAFALLESLPGSPFPRVWLELLEESAVCSFEWGLRPGALLDPFKTRWGPWLYKFARGGVPIWLHWGIQDKRVPVDPGIGYYYPPREYIEKVQRRPVWRSNVLRPHIVVPPLMTDVVDPEPSPPPFSHPHVISRAQFALEEASSAPPPAGYEEMDTVMALSAPPSPPRVDPRSTVELHSRQHAGEDWPQFYLRMQRLNEERRRNEDARTKQSRDAKAAHARKALSGASKVFEWVQHIEDPTYYVRTLVKSADKESDWDDHPADCRFYWSAFDEWDLCPVKYSEKVRVPACCAMIHDDDPDYHHHNEPNDDYSNLASEPSFSKTSVPPPSHDATLELTEALVTGPPPAHPPRKFHGERLEMYLRLRHGYSAKLGPRECWHDWLHGDGKGKEEKLSPAEWKKVVKRCVYTDLNIADENHRKALVNFHNIVRNSTLRYNDLPSPFDITTIRCRQDLLRVRSVECDLPGYDVVYVLSPPKDSRNDPSRWFVATTSATAVLLAYRCEWHTMREIAVQFLKAGIPFRTVLAVDKRDVAKPRFVQPTRVMREGLGWRAANFSPSRLDFLAYMAKRDEVLSSLAGRVLRTRGGIVGRIAAEVVSDEEVLHGPAIGDEIVGHRGDIRYVDDMIDERVLDVVCGVYHVQVSKDNPEISESSYWPKDSRWWKSGFAGDQWLPLAERFYTDRSRAICSNNIRLYNSTDWKSRIKQSVAHTNAMLKGSERWAADYLQRSSRVA